jgi:hypothetical protein
MFWVTEVAWRGRASEAFECRPTCDIVASEYAEERRMSARTKTLAIVRRLINLLFIYLTCKAEDDGGVLASGIQELPSALTKPFQVRPSTTYFPAAIGIVAPRVTENVIVVAWPGCSVTDPPPTNTGVPRGPMNSAIAKEFSVCEPALVRVRLATIVWPFVKVDCGYMVPLRIWTLVATVGFEADREMKPVEDPTDTPFWALPTEKVVFATSPEETARKV